MKSKRDSRQSFRLARTGFRLRSNGRLYVAKVGELRVRWSQDLPSEPSSVTIIRKLRRLERQKSRREKGSKNRERSRRKVAIQHGKVARARRDYHHKLALALVRDNQVIHVENLNVAGMVRNRRLSRAIADAGWAQFIQVIGEKAEKFGRTVQPVSRWLRSSKTCNECGHVLDDLPLHVRQWACPVCQTMHDRDHNAAKNILAAGRAERLNACGALVSPPDAEVRGVEAESTPDAA
jgi:putative transposase